MAVVMYAGGLARYFLGDWPKEGANAYVDLANGDAPADEDVAAEAADTADDAAAEDATPAEVQAYFTAFQAALTTALARHARSAMTWPEDLAGPQTVAFASETAFGALMMIAARSAVQNKRLAPIAIDRPWYDDPAVVEIQDTEDSFLPVHHLVKADTWLPGDFHLIVETEVPERDVIIGSLTQLAAALAAAERLLAPGSEAIRKLAPPVVTGARDALAALQQMAAGAAHDGVPALIDRC